MKARISAEGLHDLTDEYQEARKAGYRLVLEHPERERLEREQAEALEDYLEWTIGGFREHSGHHMIERLKRARAALRRMDEGGAE